MKEQPGAPGLRLPAPPLPLHLAVRPSLPHPLPAPPRLPAGLGALSLKEQDVPRPGPARPGPGSSGTHLCFLPLTVPQLNGRVKAKLLSLG